MAKVKIAFDAVGLGSETKVEVDGMELAGAVSDVTAYFSAGCLGRISLDILVHSCEITAEGVVEINSTPLTEELGLQVYKQLHSHFGKETTGE